MLKMLSVVLTISHLVIYDRRKLSVEWAKVGLLSYLF